jgi:hypothetical protein
LGFRFGWDGLIGLIPVVGDLFTNLLAAFILFRAAMAGYPPALIARMFLNLVFDNLIGAIPFAGDVADFFFRANTRNIQLMRAYNLDPDRARRRSKLWLLAILLVTLTLFIALFAGAGYLMWTLGSMFWDFLSERSALITF